MKKKTSTKPSPCAAIVDVVVAARNGLCTIPAAGRREWTWAWASKWVSEWGREKKIAQQSALLLSCHGPTPMPAVYVLFCICLPVSERQQRERERERERNCERAHIFPVWLKLCAPVASAASLSHALLDAARFRFCCFCNAHATSISFQLTHSNKRTHTKKKEKLRPAL